MGLLFFMAFALENNSPRVIPSVARNLLLLGSIHQRAEGDSSSQTRRNDAVADCGVGQVFCVACK